MIKAIIIGQILKKCLAFCGTECLTFMYGLEIFLHWTRYRVTRIQTNHTFLKIHSNIIFLLPINSSQDFFLPIFQFRYCRKVYHVFYTYTASLVPFYFVTLVTFSK